MKFIVHDERGVIIRTGSCPEDHLQMQACAGETAIEDTWDGTSDDRHRIVDAQRVDHVAFVPPAHYGILRMRAYPQMQSYLDAQVKKSSADPLVQAAGIAQEKDYFAACTAVKEQFPKPQDKTP